MQAHGVNGVDDVAANKVWAHEVKKRRVSKERQPQPSKATQNRIVCRAQGPDAALQRYFCNVRCMMAAKCRVLVVRQSRSRCDSNRWGSSRITSRIRVRSTHNCFNYPGCFANNIFEVCSLEHAANQESRFSCRPCRRHPTFLNVRDRPSTPRLHGRISSGSNPSFTTFGYMFRPIPGTNVRRSDN
jgi:hypothetical protein